MMSDKHHMVRRKAQTPKFPIKLGIPEQAQILWNEFVCAVDDLNAHTQHIRTETINFIQRGAHVTDFQGTERLKRGEAQNEPYLRQHDHTYNGIQQQWKNSQMVHLLSFSV